MKLKSGIGIISLLILGGITTNVLADNQQSSASVDQNNTKSASTSQMSGEAFLAANKNKPGVVTLADGLQYKVIKEGSGMSPTNSDVVVVHYEGKLIDGTVFDSSYKRGEPATFPVNGVIPGWVEALKLMKPGATWELFIPANLAYGEQGAPPQIGPNQTLIFKVELLSVKKPLR